MPDVPDTPEGVALALLNLIIQHEEGTEKAREFILALYSKCLHVVVKGEIDLDPLRRH